jgi:hypothetical protein
MGEGSATKVDISAAREHSVSSRRTRVHVVMCHDLDYRTKSLVQMFGMANRVSPEILSEVVEMLANDIIHDADLLIRELEGIKAFANRQRTKLPTPLQK